MVLDEKKAKTYVMNFLYRNSNNVAMPRSKQKNRRD